MTPEVAVALWCLLLSQVLLCIIVLGPGLRRSWRWGRNRCSECGSRMDRITEEQTNKQLVGIYVCSRTSCRTPERRIERSLP